MREEQVIRGGAENGRGEWARRGVSEAESPRLSPAAARDAATRKETDHLPSRTTAVRHHNADPNANSTRRVGPRPLPVAPNESGSRVACDKWFLVIQMDGE